MYREISPEQAAEWRSRWESCDGFCFLDSARRGVDQGRYSIWAASPVCYLRGFIGDVSRLDECLRAYAHGAATEVPFPAGAMIGTVDYEGNYCFGVYPTLIVTDHLKERHWWVGEDRPLMVLRDLGLKDIPTAAGRLHANLTREEFVWRVEQAQEYIRAGDIYQVNLCQHLETPWGGDLRTLYRHLRERSPSPYAAFIDQGDRQILSSSPELFLRISGRQCITRPIKGTRPRFADPLQDEQSAYELIRSAKDMAELVMITDLERNDLGQFCEYGSVRVTEVVKLERHPQVYHLVSTVEGLARPGVGHPRILQEMFPGGSITGAPKRRAREIIRELEPEPRGLYTGAIGYIGFNGESCFNIAIRTMVHQNGRLRFGVGSGITADSDPEQEYEETLHKARGMVTALEETLGRPLGLEASK